MRRWTQEEIFHEGRSYFARLLSDLESARESIVFETYIFELDSLGKKVLQVLKSAAKRGVQVRLLVDGAGSSHWSIAIQRELLEAGVKSQVFHPLFSPLGKINKRNHRKVCVIDRSVAFVGGINVSAKHLDWRDTAARLEGSDVEVLYQAFEAVWHRSFRKRPLRQRLSLLVKLNDSFKKRRKYRKEILRRVVTAKDRVWITNPYFVPEFSLLRALRFSAWSGVDVRIILPRKNDVFFMYWLNRAFYSVLLNAGVRIFEYLPTTLHAKALVIDGWFILGSSNRNHRSLIHDLEVDVVLTLPESRESIERQFYRDQKVSREVTRSAWRKRPLISSMLQIVLEKFLLIFKHWL